MPIDEYEHDKLIDINNHMDASKVKDSDDAHLNSMIAAPVYSAKSSSKSSNPIKDGLADTTLHILKATLKTMNDKHNRYIAKNKATTEVKHNFMPTMAIHSEMEQNMLVIEQIRCILFGVAYEIKDDFFESKKFRELVESLADNESFEDVLDTTTRDISFNIDKINANNHKDKKDHDESNEEENRHEYWTQRIKDFLLKSNEKWLLDQFNLCKRFINQNSIDGQLSDFYHVVFDRFSNIVAMKRNFGLVENNYRTITSPKNDTGEKRLQMSRPGSANRDSNLGDQPYVPNNQAEEEELKVLKIDVPALIKAIEEIENRIKMEKILTKNKMDKLNEVFKQNEDMMERIMMKQFAMLNFKKNYIALKYAQENPSDVRNQAL